MYKILGPAVTDSAPPYVGPCRGDTVRSSHRLPSTLGGTHTGRTGGRHPRPRQDRDTWAKSRCVTLIFVVDLDSSYPTLTCVPGVFSGGGPSLQGVICSESLSDRDLGVRSEVPCTSYFPGSRAGPVTHYGVSTLFSDDLRPGTCRGPSPDRASVPPRRSRRPSTTPSDPDRGRPYTRPHRPTHLPSRRCVYRSLIVRWERATWAPDLRPTDPPVRPKRHGSRPVPRLHPHRVCPYPRRS